MSIHFRKAQASDSERLFQWRNDPLTRSQSLQTGAISKDEHEAWLNASLASADRQIYLAFEAESAVGMVRFDRREGAWELSWSLAPEHRGRGLGKAMVQTAALLLPETLVARIKVQNAASEAIARAAGFLPSGQENGIGIWHRAKNP